MQSSQFKSLGFFNRPFLVPKPDSCWRPILDLSNPTFRRPTVGYLNSFQGHLLPYTYTRTIQERPEIYHPRSGIPVQGPAFRFVHSTLGVHHDPKGGETNGHTQGFKKPPVPRRLVGESQIPPGLSPTYTGTSK